MSGFAPSAQTGPSIRFYSKECQNPRSNTVEFKDFVEIRHPGEDLNVIDRPVTPADVERWGMQWRMYLGKKEQPHDGIPITLLFTAQPKIVDLLKRNSVFSIEALAGLSAHAIGSIGMGCQDWVNAAKRYLEQAKEGVDRHKFESTIKELKDENGELKQKIESLTNIVNRLLTALPESS